MIVSRLLKSKRFLSENGLQKTLEKGLDVFLSNYAGKKMATWYAIRKEKKKQRLRVLPILPAQEI